MDAKKCVRSSFAYMPPSGIRLDSYAENKHTTKKGKQRPSRERKCQGDIVYVQNPLFKNVALRLKDNSKNYEVVPLIYEQNNTGNNYYFHRFFSPNHSLQESKKPPQESRKKIRKDGMKERAENRRRDILSDESSDQDYSSINSTNDLRLPNNSRKNSSKMDDACNRRSRSARTERYFRRLSREDNNLDYESSAANCRIIPKRIQDVKFSVGKCETQQFPHPGRNNLGDRGPNLLFCHQDDIFLNNPIYRTSRSDAATFYEKHSRKETTENQAYGANIDYNKTRRSDPGNESILAYKNNKSPRTVDRVQYIEPQIFNYQQPRQIFQQNKPAIDPKRHVRRSYSFQSENPKEYEKRNNVPVTMHRAPIAHASKLGNNNSRIERKEIDSILSPVSPTSDHSAGDYQRRKLYLAKENMEFKAENKNPTTTYDSSSKNLSSNVTEDKILAKKRSSKDLGKELSELEKMYTSLRLSDDNLLERAEERCVEEFSHKGQSQALNNDFPKYLSSGSSSDSIAGDGLSGEKYPQQSSEAHVINDDMAYRKMQTKKMPALSDTQNSLSQISYLLASSALILGDTEYPDITHKVVKEEPNITKDDMVYRNLHYANKVLKVVEPQPPFGIPLRPATPSTNSNYLCSSPVALKSPPLKYVPESEPNLITDDLAFRNLRKDAPKSPPILSEDNGNEVNAFSLKIEFDKPLDEDKFCKKKKRAVRSLSANLYGLIKEVNNLELNIK